MDVDAEGTAYLADAWVGSVSVSATKDRGQSWQGTPISLTGDTFDRPWVLGGEAGEVFVTAVAIPGTLVEEVADSILGVRDAPTAGGIWVSRSTDGGKTFPQQVLVAGNEDRFPTSSNLASGKGNLYVYYVQAVGDNRSRHMVAVSKDQGLTWTQKVAGELPYDRNNCAPYPMTVFPVVAADDVGGVYLVTSYMNPATRRNDIFLFASPDEGERWQPPIMIADRPGDRITPWISAAGEGRVGIVWYESKHVTYADNATDPVKRATCEYPRDETEEWFIHYAESQNALSESPLFVDVLVQPTLIHKGTFGRPYGEVIQVKFDTAGRAVVAYVTDTPDTTGSAAIAIQSKPPSG